MHFLFGLLGFLSLTSITVLATPPPAILVDPVFHGSDRQGIGAFALEIAQADLSSDDSMRLVERKSLDKVLSEQGLVASGFAAGESAANIGKLLSANYLVSVKGMVAGDRMMVILRAVDVETTRFKSKTITLNGNPEPDKLAKRLEESIREAIGELGADGVSEAPNEVAKVDFTDEVKRPKIAIFVPESTDGQRARVDPACEHSLMERLIDNRFTVTQLEHSSHAIPFGADGRPQGEEFEKLLAAARDKQIEVLIIGEAFSQRAGMLGPLTSSRARVEMHALRVSDQSIINSISRYGTAVDASLAISGKKAIEDATDRSFIPFANALMASF